MIIYACDSCGKEIPTNENRYRIRMGLVNALYNETIGYKMERDLCGKCYDKIVSMFKTGITQDVLGYLSKEVNNVDNKEDK